MTNIEVLKQIPFQYRMQALDLLDAFNETKIQKDAESILMQITDDLAYAEVLFLVVLEVKRINSISDAIEQSKQLEALIDALEDE